MFETPGIRFFLWLSLFGSVPLFLALILPLWPQNLQFPGSFSYAFPSYPTYPRLNQKGKLVAEYFSFSQARKPKGKYGLAHFPGCLLLLRRAWFSIRPIYNDNPTPNGLYPFSLLHLFIVLIIELIEYFAYIVYFLRHPIWIQAPQKKQFSLFCSLLYSYCLEECLA